MQISLLQKLRGAGAKKGAANMEFKRLVALLLIAAVILMLLGGWVWYRFILTDPNRVLNGMLKESLSTSSVYRTVNQTEGQTDVEQAFYVSYSPNLVAQTVTKLAEQGQQGQNSTITTETIGTRSTDFVRYTSIDVPGNTPNQNFKDVLGKWGKRDADQKAGQNAAFLNEAMFMIVPFGNLSGEDRKQLLDYIDRSNVYSYKSTKLEKQNGRLVRVYEIELSPEKLVDVLSRYAIATGVGDLSQLNPAAYKGAQAINISMTVDVLSRHLTDIAFADTGRFEKYNSYGLKKEISYPEQTITIDELQKRLQPAQ